MPHPVISSTDDVTRKLQENLLATQKVQEVLTQVHAQRGSGVPIASMHRAQPERGSAILLDPLEGEGGEDEIPLSQSALMYMPPHLIPNNLKETGGNLRKIRALGTGGHNHNASPWGFNKYGDSKGNQGSVFRPTE